MFFPSLRFFDDFAIILSDWKKKKINEKERIYGNSKFCFVKQRRLEYKSLDIVYYVKYFIFNIFLRILQLFPLVIDRQTRKRKKKKNLWEFDSAVKQRRTEIRVGRRDSITWYYLGAKLSISELYSCLTMISTRYRRLLKNLDRL